MTTRIVEESGDTLVGALDSSNKLFTTTLPMRLDRIVEVYINGLRRIAELDDGYDLPSPTQVRLKMAPVPEDTVAVGYSADPIRPGVPNAYPEDLRSVSLVPQSLSAITLAGPPAPIIVHPGA